MPRLHGGLFGLDDQAEGGLGDIFSSHLDGSGEKAKSWGQVVHEEAKEAKEFLDSRKAKAPARKAKSPARKAAAPKRKAASAPKRKAASKPKRKAASAPKRKAASKPKRKAASPARKRKASPKRMTIAQKTAAAHAALRAKKAW